MAIMGFCLYRDISAIAASNRERTAIRRSLMHAAQLQTFLSDAESGQRGFLLTQEEEYLAPYHEAIQAIEALLTTMRTEPMAVQNPRHWKEVESLINERLYQLAETLRMRREAGRNSRVNIAPNPAGPVLTKRIRESFDYLQASERKSLHQVISDHDNNIFWHSVHVALQGIIGLLIAALAWLRKRGTPALTPSKS